MPGVFKTTKTSRKTSGALKKIVDIIARSADPDRIILFGSRSKGSQTQKSDYDICVIKKGVKHRRELAMKLYRDLYGVGVPVDVIVETPETFEEFRDNPFMIYHDIAKQGRIIYEKPVTCSKRGFSGHEAISPVPGRERAIPISCMRISVSIANRPQKNPSKAC
ncbi:MAG: nucleotidyltransferase domain-containing protein [Methanoregula sp.]